MARHNALLTLLLLCGCNFSPGHLEGPVRLDDPDRTYAIGRHLSFFQDDTGERTLADVSAAPELFRPSDSSRPYFPMRAAMRTVWTRFEVEDLAPAGTRWVLRMREALPEEMEFYSVAADGRLYHERSGFKIEWSERQHPERLIHLELPTNGPAQRTYYFRTQSRLWGSNLQVLEADQYERERKREDAWLGAYVGLALAMILYNLFLGRALRDPAYAYYSLFCGGFAFYNVDRLGFLSALSDGTIKAYTSGGISLPIAELATLAFVRAFLDTKHTQPRMDFALRMIFMGSTLGMVLGLMGVAGATTVIGTVLGLACSLLVPVVTLISALQGYRPAWYFFVSVSVLAFGGITTTATWMGATPIALYTGDTVLFGSAFDMVVLAFGLADRVRFMEEQRASDARVAAGLVQAQLQRDIDANRKARDLQQSKFGRLLQARERERRQLSQRLDQAIGRRMAQVHDGLVALQRDSLTAAARAEARGSVVDAQTIVSDIYPQPLEDLGLVAALEQLVDKVRAASDVRIESDLDPRVAEQVPSQEHRLHVFRIVQEAISNAVKHGHADRITVRLQQDDGAGLLHVHDDGVGFDSSAGGTPDSASSLGLYSLIERGRMLGGHASIASGAGEGTHVAVRFPLSSSTAATEGRAASREAPGAI